MIVDYDKGYQLMRGMQVTDYMQIAEKVFLELDIEVSRAQLRAMALYVVRLVAGLNQARLTGESSIEGLFNKQIFDSLYLLKLIDFGTGRRILDLGSGGGLPGIPLHIVSPGNYTVLLDSNKKKTTFLNNTVKALALQNIDIINGRAEEYGHIKEHRAGYDFVVSKAVAEMNVLVEYALPFLKTQGMAILFKGPRGDQELKKAERAIKACGGVFQQKYFYRLPGGEERYLYLIIKKEETPQKYPRRTGVPTRNPL